ncbi:short-chain dehydrogenase/reductase SDR [Aspergillus steynii IBT 23096]|uniref:Short-chain dehydrogenase/reductase SDR n=1 Tax=Aspergillus steynii IBT 23096 TaxID=1392250 RepID=A0A2I2GB57_9EURO|nr:short-chain dehydrogenase/reductase SDR [Aspergillus steynii IBT 23096]PLB50095.1 short-chain dehydrogenase/reductase SDR [Aspergillus steynii IBT 23096]
MTRPAGLRSLLKLAPIRGPCKPRHYNTLQYHRAHAATVPVEAEAYRRTFSSVAIPSAPREAILSRILLDGKVTVITGGSRGIGLTLAQTVASLGSDVAILDVQEPETRIPELEKTYGTRFSFERLDVTSKDSMENVFAKVVQDMGRIDNCITCAGVALDKPFLEHTWDESRRILDINILGSFFAAQLAAKQIIQQNTSGSIIMIASIAAHCAIPAQRVSIYGASKAAIKLLGKTLAVELAPYNVRVNTLSPGFIETEMTKQFVDIQDVLRTTPPMGRIGQVGDLALAVAYLLSDGAAYTTGADVPVTGGLHGGRIGV